MENIYGLIDLTDNELKEQNGGFPILLIRLFVPTIEGILGFSSGLKEGYIRSTKE
jgi:hypothetical protein